MAWWQIYINQTYGTTNASSDSKKEYWSLKQFLSSLFSRCELPQFSWSIESAFPFSFSHPAELPTPTTSYQIVGLQPISNSTKMTRLQGIDPHCLKKWGTDTHIKIFEERYLSLVRLSQLKGLKLKVFDLSYTIFSSPPPTTSHLHLEDYYQWSKL